MSEPDFLVQTADPMPDEERHVWLHAMADEGRAKGCTWGRASWHEETGTLLYEGWIERPRDEGPPRFQFTTQEPEPCR